MSDDLRPIDLALAAATPPAEEATDPFMVARIRGLLIGYDARWKDATWAVEAVEQEVVSPLINPDTGRKSRAFPLHCSKLDVLAHHICEGLCVVEHKTTSEKIDDPDAPLFKRLPFDSQVSKYALSCWQSGKKVSAVVYDLCRKPGIRPRKLTKADYETLIHSGEYCGFVITGDSKMAAAESGDENPELFEYRVARETIDNPDSYFVRKPLRPLDNEIVDYARELWDIARDMHWSHKEEMFTRNPGACLMYGRPCEYLGICSGHDTPDSDKWVRKEQVHRELETQFKDGGRKVLTHSRIRCWQTCKRKEYFRYIMGLERADSDDGEALTFGRLFHLGLEAWWKENHKKRSG